MAKNATSFGGEKGNKAGRTKGAESSITKKMKTVREVVLDTFNKLQDDPHHNLEAFARKYPRDFHQIAARLIPTEIQADIKVAAEITFNEVKTYDITPEGIISNEADS